MVFACIEVNVQSIAIVVGLLARSREVGLNRGRRCSHSEGNVENDRDMRRLAVDRLHSHI